LGHNNPEGQITFKIGDVKNLKIDGEESWDYVVLKNILIRSRVRSLRAYKLKPCTLQNDQQTNGVLTIFFKAA